VLGELAIERASLAGQGFFVQIHLLVVERAVGMERPEDEMK
jgi:hypothetical protein